MAYRAPSTSDTVSSEGKCIELWMDLRPSSMDIICCPLPEVGVIVQPRRVFEFATMLHDHELICNQLSDVVGILGDKNEHISAVHLHPSCNVRDLSSFPLVHLV